MNLASEINEQYLETLPTQDKLPDEGDKLVWKFYDLKKVDDFTVQLIFTLFQFSKTKIMFEWTGHPWFQLLQGEKEAQFIKTMQLTGSKLYCIVGGETPTRHPIYV